MAKSKASKKKSKAARKAPPRRAADEAGPPSVSASPRPTAGRRTSRPTPTTRAATPRPDDVAAVAGDGAGPRLLSGGNPQIAKADGDAPVQAYIAAMPGWKRDVGRRLDALVTSLVPGVRKAVRWNSPFYGVDGQGWFLAYHCITKYIKVTFFRGMSLRPIPPFASKLKDVRYFHIHENDAIDEVQLASWIKQSAALPGETVF